jgi:hybrid cluster-associated redox disulfide protein
MLIGELVRQHPEAGRFLFERGIHCVGCAVASMETLEQGLKGHGYSDEQIDSVVKELNRKLGKK